MAFTCGFFNSIGHDRKYDARQFNTIFDGLITDGVYQNYLEEFKVTAAEADNTITVGTGRAWLNNTWNLNDPAEDYELQPSDSAQDRIDAVVLEVNNERAVRDNDIKIVQGIPSDVPQKPALVNTELIHQYPLAYVTRKAGVNKVDASNIQNMVGTAECPYARLLYPYTPPSDTPDTPAEPSELEKHIVYDATANSLDFQVATLLQNGSPLKLGGGGIEPVILYNNTGYGANLPITLAENNFDLLFIIVEYQILTELGNGANGNDFWQSSVAMPTDGAEGGKWFRIICSTVHGDADTADYSTGIIAGRMILRLSGTTLDVDGDGSFYSFATAIQPYYWGAQSVTTTNYTITTDTQGTYAYIKNNAATQGINIVTANQSNPYANSRITKVVGYRKVG